MVIIDVPPPKVRGRILVSVRIPLALALASHFLYARYLLIQSVEFHQAYRGILFGHETYILLEQAKVVIRFLQNVISFLRSGTLMRQFLYVMST